MRINPDLLKRVTWPQRIEIIENAGRKGFTPSEMVKISRLLQPHAEALAHERHDAQAKANLGLSDGGNLPPSVSGKTRDQLAAVVGISGRTLEKARAIVEAAEREPETYGDLVALMDRSGKVEGVHRHLGARQRQMAARQSLRAFATTSQRVDVRPCSMQDLLTQLRNLDTILTDLPYSAASVPLFGELARLAKDALAPTGILAAMAGQAYLPEILAAMCPHFPYRWVFAAIFPNKAPVAKNWARYVLGHWKPVLIFGTRHRRFLMDDVITFGRDKRFHEWGQDVDGFAALVERLTEPGMLVCDPCAGSGTTGVAAVMLGRRFVGCDIDEESVQVARARIGQALAAAEGGRAARRIRWQNGGGDGDDGRED